MSGVAGSAQVLPFTIVTDFSVETEMHPYVRGVALAGAACLLGLPTVASAQNLGVIAVRASSANVELPHPQGLGVFAQVDAGGFGFRLSVMRYSDSTRKQGVVCQVYSPRIACGTEGVETSARMSGFRADVLKTLSLGEIVEFGAGGGVSFNSVSATSTGESGRVADLLVPTAGQIGRQATFTVSVAPVPGIPLRLVGGYALHWVKLRGCASIEDKTSGYDPFCGTERFREVQVGASFIVPRR